MPTLALYNNDLRPIIDIPFYAIFSTFYKKASLKSAGTSLHFN